MTRPGALDLQGLSKAFGDVQAVDSLTLAIRPGEIYGFLGPNGAGKTTTLKIVLGLTYPDAGRVLVEGLDLMAHPHEVRRRVGYLPERLGFYGNLTALQNLQFFARLKGGTPDGLREALDAVGLGEFAEKKVRTYSKGMVQLLGFAQVMMGAPRLLILDEPTTGLDPNWTRVVKDRIRQANREGTTVFFSSHILSEVQELAHRVGILNRGRLLAEDTVENLGARLEIKPRLRVEVAGDPERAVALLESVEGVEEVRAEGPRIVVVCAPSARARVLRHLESNGIEVRDFRTEDPSLEDVFLRYTGTSGGRV